MKPSDVTRPSLLIRIKDHRDRAAWSQFVEIYAPLVYETARRRGLQDCDAADLTQEVLRSVAGAVERLDYDPARGSFRGWLYTVTRNALNTYFEARRRQPHTTGDESALSGIVARPSQDDESALWDRDYQKRLLAYASEQVRVNFEETTWNAFWQTAVEGKPGKTVAASLGISVGAVYIARSRVLSQIREQIRHLLDE